MNRSQFELALNHAKASDWEHFEILCSIFLASEHSNMRTLASASGDGGRDSELFSPDGGNYICAQYSVTEHWRAKINKTKARVISGFKDIKIIIYLSSKAIGADADELKKTFLLNKIVLDIRDKNWFLERYQSDDLKYKGAVEFFNRIGRPYLEGLEVISKKRQSLSNQEAKAALVYLGMQLEDSQTAKGLTKLSYEALVRAALRGTSSSNCMSKEKICSVINSYLPSHSIDSVRKYVESALNRLDKNIVKQRGLSDQYHLAFDESERLNAKLADQELHERALDEEITSFIFVSAPDMPKSEAVSLKDLAIKILDLAILRSGENFAFSVISGSVQKLDKDLLRSLIIDKLSGGGGLPKKRMDAYPSILLSVLEKIIASPNDSVRRHLKNLSDTYTLFAFLRETPDVQKATAKIFSFGKIWLDTTMILPLLADQLKSADGARRFSTILNSIIKCGSSVFVSDAAINEVLNHIRLSVSCSKMGANWRGRVPYLFSQYIQDGRAAASFSEWVEIFRGDERPETDIREFLSSEYGIKHEDLTCDYLKSDETLRHSVDRHWREAHEARRSSLKGYADSDTLEILIKNDVISYLGIIEKRKSEENNELGYQHWWLTLDSIAWGIRNSLSKEFDKLPASPLISLDFLVQNISFGPSKDHISRSHEQLLPILLDMDLSEVIPPEVIKVAEEARANNDGLPEHVIRRKVRDACDIARRQIGDLTRGIEVIR